MNRIALMLITLCFVACNSEVFVDDFEPSETEVVLYGAGDTKTVRFSSDSWTYLTANDPFDSFYFHRVLYDLEGNETGGGSTLKMLGRMKVITDGLKFTLERLRPDELTLTVDEMTRTDSYYIDLVVSSDYDFKIIRLTIYPR